MKTFWGRELVIADLFHKIDYISVYKTDSFKVIAHIDNISSFMDNRTQSF